VARGVVARLADLGIEAEIGNELAGRGEAPDVADRGDQRGGAGHIDPGHRHEPLRFARTEDKVRDLGVEQRNLAVEEVDLAQADLGIEAEIGNDRLAHARQGRGTLSLRKSSCLDGGPCRWETRGGRG
jgi:hypothetical protein